MVKLKKKSTDIEDYLIDQILKGNIIFGKSKVKNTWMRNPLN